jgi:hypothetical protein
VIEGAGEANSKVKHVGMEVIVGSEAFAVGYDEVAQSIAFDPFRFTDGADQWLYERGRHFAIHARAEWGKHPKLYSEGPSGLVLNAIVVAMVRKMGGLFI